MKKLSALLIAILMVLNLGVAALADPTPSPSPHTSEDDHGSSASAKVSGGTNTIQNVEGQDIAEGYTDFYVNVDRDGTSTSGAVVVDEADIEGDYGNWYRVNYTVKTQSNISVTVPLYVCMYAYGGDGSVVVPGDSQGVNAYHMENSSTRAITSTINSDGITAFYKVTGVGTAGPDGLYASYEYHDNTGTLQTLTDFNTNDLVRLVDSVAGDGTTTYKEGMFYRDERPNTFTANGKTYTEGQSYPDLTTDGTYGLGARVATIKVEEKAASTGNAKWELLSADKVNELKRQQFVMTVNNFDLADAIDKGVDISNRKWDIAAPTVTGTGSGANTTYTPAATSLSLPITAAIAGNSVNDDLHAGILRISYTIVPGSLGAKATVS